MSEPTQRLYFFGVYDPNQKGHYLYTRNGSAIWGQRHGLPFRYEALDGSFLQHPEKQGRPHLAVINGWTILGMWDTTGDSRPNSNSSFIAEGVFTLAEMKEIAAREFPNLWTRIRKGLCFRCDGPINGDGICQNYGCEGTYKTS